MGYDVEIIKAGKDGKAVRTMLPDIGEKKESKKEKEKKKEKMKKFKFLTSRGVAKPPPDFNYSKEQILLRDMFGGQMGKPILGDLRPKLHKTIISGDGLINNHDEGRTRSMFGESDNNDTGKMFGINRRRRFI